MVDGTPPPQDYEAFRAHPLAAWIESVLGVRREPGSGVLVRQTPRRLEGAGSAAQELATLTGTDPDACAAALRRFLLVASTLRGPGSRYPIFAFRLYQFFTRGDTVWATIEPEAERYLDIAKQGAKPGEPDKPLFPLVFCRHCGTAYYRVKEVAGNGEPSLQPREDRRLPEDDGSGDAYL